MKVVQWWGVVVSACHIIIALCDVWDEQPDLACGMDSMQVIIPKQIKGDLRLKVLNKEGKMEVLRNNPICGMWMTQKSNASIVIAAAYDGCYVTQMGTEYVLTIGLSARQGDRKTIAVKKEMRCSVGLYHDAPSPDQCAAISKADRLSCSGPQGSCESMGCCYDASDTAKSCYFGNTVTARCTQDGLFSIAVSKMLTFPSLDLNSIKLLGSGAECNPTARNNVFLLYQFPLSSCGTTVKMTGDQTVYENTLVASKTLQKQNGVSITRDTTFRLLVRCLFTVSGFFPLKAEVVTLPPPLPVSSQGPLSFQMRIAVDSQYRDYYRDSNYPVIRVLREPVFVEVQILQKSDPNLILVLHNCWATPDTDPLTVIQWPILVNGCPFSGDNYLSELVPVNIPSTNFPSHYSRFNLKTFIFVDEKTQQPLGGQVYIHCGASACVPSQTDRCVPTCSKRKRSTDVILNTSEEVLVSSDVAVYFDNSQSEAQNDLSGLHRVSFSWADILLSSLAVAMGILAVLILALTIQISHRQRTRKSVLISDLLSAKDKTIHITSLPPVNGLSYK